jgi:RHS repeat-associated protein
VTTRYTYNAAGQRVRKVSSTGSDSTVVFVHDQAGHLLGEYDRNGAALREYVWLRDTPMAMFTPDPANPAGEPLVYFIHSDHLNTPRVVVDRQNRVRWRWLAEPFGTSAPETDPSGLGVFTQNLRFPGQYADQESGLFYNYHRYYAAEGGQYTQSDPVGLAGGSVSTYGYVGGKPLQWVDPSGLCPICPAIYLFLVENSVAIGTATVIGAEIATGVPNPVSTPASFAGRAVQELTHDVYVGMRAGAPVYVGISKNISERACRHGDRFDELMKLNHDFVTKDQARAIEQAIIEANPSFQNGINSIAKNRDWYEGATQWARDWLRQQGK